MTITEQIHQSLLTVLSSAWMPAVEPGGEIRDGSWVAELDGDCPTGRPKGMRLFVREERPHLGAQLRFTHHWDWTDVITSAIERLDALPNPG